MTNARNQEKFLKAIPPKLAANIILNEEILVTFLFR